MSSPHSFTRSAPIVSCLFMAKAIFNFVPTPSMLATKIGSRIPGKFARNNPPKPPILPSTSRPCVCLTSEWMRRLSLLARSTSTPARAYAFFVFVMSSEVETSLILIARDFSTPLRFARNDKLLLQIREQRGLRLLIGHGFGALLASFHDAIVQC